MNEVGMTKQEISRRATLEQRMTECKSAFVEFGNALVEIRESKLYRNTHTSFESYCKEVWGYSKGHVYRLMDAAGLAEKLGKVSNLETLTESKARALLKLPEERREEALAADPRTFTKTVKAIAEEDKYSDLKDALGNDVPANLVDDWDFAVSVGKDIRNAGQFFKRTVDAHIAKGEKYIQKHNLDKTMSKDIGDIVSELSRAIPYAVCPYCEGSGERCANCHSRGWVSKLYWNHHVPEKIKKTQGNGAS